MLSGYWAGNPLYEQLQPMIASKCPAAPVTTCHCSEPFLIKPEAHVCLDYLSIDFAFLVLLYSIFTVVTCIDSCYVLPCPPVFIIWILVVLCSSINSWLPVPFTEVVLLEANELNGLIDIHSLTQQHAHIELWVVRKHDLLLNASWG